MRQEPMSESGSRKPDNSSLTIEITQLCYTRSLIYRGKLPGLVIGDSANELVLTSGARLQDAVLAKEFAIALASNALSFAGICNRRLVPGQGWPADDPETLGERA